MKNIFLLLLFTLTLGSCEKGSIKETTDNIKRVDSLFTKANDGLKTLDSISKTINDSNGIAKKVIIPEIEKQKKVIDSTIKSGGYKIDSINKELEKITKNVKTGTDVVKTLDSANQALQKGESPIKVLTRTADKILNETKNQNSVTPKTSTNAIKTLENTVVIPPVVQKNPISKSAKMEIQVENLSNTKAILKQKIRDSNADLITENFSQTEGVLRENFTIKVPLQNFDQMVANLSQMGDIKMKATESTGTDYVSRQMCDVEITLLQNDQLADTSVTTNENAENKTDSFSEKSSGAFMSGFKTLGDIFIAILPYWPIFIIAGLIFYFVHRNKKNREKEEWEKQQNMNQQSLQPTPKVENEVEKTENKKSDEGYDYKKYMPKN